MRDGAEPYAHVPGFRENGEPIKRRLFSIEKGIFLGLETGRELKKERIGFVAAKW